MKGEANSQGAPSVVLVVDDDPLVRGLIARVLAEEGFPVVTAASGEEALVAAHALEGDLPLVVTDIRMPGIDGIKMAERLVHFRRALGCCSSPATPRPRAYPARFLSSLSLLKRC